MYNFYNQKMSCMERIFCTSMLAFDLHCHGGILSDPESSDAAWVEGRELTNLFSSISACDNDQWFTLLFWSQQYVVTTEVASCGCYFRKESRRHHTIEYTDFHLKKGWGRVEERIFLRRSNTNNGIFVD